MGTVAERARKASGGGGPAAGSRSLLGSGGRSRRSPGGSGGRRAVPSASAERHLPWTPSTGVWPASAPYEEPDSLMCAEGLFQEIGGGEAGERSAYEYECVAGEGVRCRTW